MKNTSEDKKIVYMLLCIVALVIVYALVFMVLANVIMGIFGLSRLPVIAAG